jgi:hypothetical protein
MRQNATTGAPVRSEPKLGKAWAHRPSRKPATEQLRRRDDTLAAPPVDAYLKEHAPTLPSALSGCQGQMSSAVGDPGLSSLLAARRQNTRHGGVDWRSTRPR